MTNRHPLTDRAIPKKLLMTGCYYAGHCRNASIARWDGTQFHYVRVKWGSTFVEAIKHPDDETQFDAFIPLIEVRAREVVPIKED